MEAEKQVERGNAAINAFEKSITDSLRFTRKGNLVLVALGALVAAGGVAYGWQLVHGLAATGMNNYFSWGVYIINFVFFVGVSMAGTFISAILRLTNADWRRPITRLAEAITLFALSVAGMMILVDMGRPDRLLFILYHGRLQSPILWDVLSFATYFAGSLLYLYAPLLPDLAYLRDKPGFPRWRKRLYSALALGWHGTEQQHRRLTRIISVMAVVIIPVAVSIHTVTAWLFSMTLRPGWHSTIIGPDFVVGAMYSGTAAVITAMALFRHGFGLQKYLTPEHFRKLGKLLITFCLVYLYFTINEYVDTLYTKKGIENDLVRVLWTGRFATIFWSMAVLALLIPGTLTIIALAAGKLRRHAVGLIVTASIFVNIGMWLMRFLIVVPTLSVTFLPMTRAAAGRARLYYQQTAVAMHHNAGSRLAGASAHVFYRPTWVEWTITVAGFAAVALCFLVFARIFPVISLWEMEEELGSLPETAGAGLRTAEGGKTTWVTPGASYAVEK